MTEEARRATGTDRRPAWIWPWRPSAGLAARALRAGRGVADLLGPWPCWVVAGAVAGVVPLLVCYWTGWRGNHLASAVLLLPLFVGALVRDSVRHAAAGVGAGFLAHSAVLIGLAANDGAGIAQFFPAGADYWEQSRAWIVTGRSQEYDVSWWLPAHAQLLAAAALFTYTSLGFVTFWQGFHEVDLMNVYVGRLLAHSDNPELALAVGWHPWSLCRAAGYFLLAFEVASLSLGRLTGTPLSTPARRRVRLGVGLGFLLLDAGLKFLLLEPVRRVLAGNLIQT